MIYAHLIGGPGDRETVELVKWAPELCYAVVPQLTVGPDWEDPEVMGAEPEIHRYESDLHSRERLATSGHVDYYWRERA